MNALVQSHYQRFGQLARVSARLETTLPANLDWCCVVMFYAALHLLDAYFSTKSFPFPVDSHPNRNRAARMSPELRRFGTAYRELQQVSEQVRYDPGFVFKPEHHAAAKRNFAKVVSVLEPKVKRLLGMP